MSTSVPSPQDWLELSRIVDFWKKDNLYRDNALNYDEFGLVKIICAEFQSIEESINKKLTRNSFWFTSNSSTKMAGIGFILLSPEIIFSKNDSDQIVGTPPDALWLSFLSLQQTQMPNMKSLSKVPKVLELLAAFGIGFARQNPQPSTDSWVGIWSPAISLVSEFAIRPIFESSLNKLRYLFKLNMPFDPEQLNDIRTFSYQLAFDSFRNEITTWNPAEHNLREYFSYTHLPGGFRRKVKLLNAGGILMQFCDIHYGLMRGNVFQEFSLPKANWEDRFFLKNQAIPYMLWRDKNDHWYEADPPTQLLNKTIYTRNLCPYCNQSPIQNSRVTTVYKLNPNGLFSSLEEAIENDNQDDEDFSTGEFNADLEIAND